VGSRNIQLKENVVAIPMIVTGAGAEALADLSNCEMIYIEKNLLNHYTNNKNIIAAKIIGNSMEEDFKENDLVLIELVRNQNFVKNDGIYLVRYGDIVQLKQVQFLGNGEILLRSTNTKYAPINPNKDYGIEWEILGKPLVKIVVEYYSDLQYTKVSTIEK
jgi:phage repressor protein C with HTH and peptisase S24 domain